MYFFINIALNILSTENSSKIGNSKKKGKRTIKKINYKLIVGKNKLITKKKHKFSNIQCYVKNGLIYYINVRPVAPKYQIKVTPVFITIYVDKLLITKDEMKGEVIKSVPLVDIQRIDQHYLGTFCFDIILNQIQNNRLKAGQLSLCAKNEKEMNIWVNSILEFKKCSLKGGKRIDHNGKIVLDLQKMTDFTTNYSIGKHYELEDLYYDADDTAFRIDNNNKNNKITKIKKFLTNIITGNRMGEIATSQLHRQYRGRLIRANEFRKKMKQKMLRMKKSRANKIFREKEKEAKLLHKKVAKKQMRMIKNAAQKISKFKIFELNQYKKLYEHEINIQKQEAINRSKRLMRKIQEENRLTNYAQCFSRELEEFKNKRVIEKICNQLYGLFVYIILTSGQKSMYEETKFLYNVL
jgi:hypothetical protein